MSLQCIFNRFSVYVDVVSNENVALFWIQSLSVSRGITFLITELPMFSLALPPVGSVSIIEPEAPGVLLRFSPIMVVQSASGTHGSAQYCFHIKFRDAAHKATKATQCGTLR